MSVVRARNLLAAAAAALALAEPGASPRAQDPGEKVVALQVGEAAPVGPAPVRNVICDDPSVVRLEDGPTGPVLVGLAPGKTRCSLTDAMSVRRLYRVTVVAAPPGTPAPGAAGR
jgi:hypothetical protein